MNWKGGDEKRLLQFKFNKQDLGDGQKFWSPKVPVIFPVNFADNFPDTERCREFVIA